MSVTTTTNPHLSQLLSEYNLHHSQPSSTSSAPAPPPNHTSSPNTTTNNPPGWESSWRRVPAHRPAVNQRDEARDTYTSEIERNFVRVMFGGVWMMATASQVWRATGGKFNSDFFKYKIGGEW